jgi:rhodanese-related sulfurtransferase
MSTSQILFYVVLVLVVLVYLRRFLVTRKVPRYTPAQLADLMKSSSPLLLDVRTASEREKRVIRGSMHIPLQELKRRMGELEKFKNREVVCYCHSGSRSLIAAVQLRREGYNAASLDGGIVEWEFATKL